jgi:hypothetical protein
MPTRTLFFASAFVGLLTLAGASFGDDPTQTVPRGPLGSGANQAVSGQPGGLPVNQSTSALNRGLGQIVSGWTHDGIHGQELAVRIHQLQGKSFDDRTFRRSRDRNDRYDRDRFEDRREGDRERREDRRETDRDRDRREDRKEADRDRREDRRGGNRDSKGPSGKGDKSPGKGRR